VRLEPAGSFQLSQARSILPQFVPDLIVGWQQHDAAIQALQAEVKALRERIH
jgi:hypothetical protein